MKKLLSILLACALVMSLFCVVPASATMIGTTGIYVFEDFEDGTSSVTPTGSGGNVEVVTADNGSSKALKHTFSNDTSYPDLNIPGSFKISKEFTTDMALRGSVRYKLGTPLSKGCISLLTVNETSYFSTWKIDNLTDTTNWYTAEFEIPAFAVARDSAMFQLRIGDSGAKSTQAVEGDVVIYLDDLQITREKNTNKEIIHMNHMPNFTYNAGSRTAAADPFDSNNRVLKLTPSSNGGLYNLLYFQNEKSPVTYSVGDTITVSIDILVTDMWYEHDLNFRLYPRATGNGSDADANISEIGSQYYTKKYLGSKRGEWQTLTYSFVVTKLSSGKYKPYFYLSENPDTTTDRTADDDKRRDMGHYTYYFDNLTVEVSDRSDYIIPSATGLTATMAEDGTVTPSYTYAETAVSGVEAGTDISLLKVKKANGAVVASAVAGNALVVPEAYRNEALTLEVIPVSSTGTFGDAVVTAAITTTPAVEPIVGTTLTQADGSVTVATETAITGAKLVFVTYDASGRMVDWEAADVTLGAQGTQVYAPVALTAGSYTRAMLWQDMVECIPLADMIQY